MKLEFFKVEKDHPLYEEAVDIIGEEVENVLEYYAAKSEEFTIYGVKLDENKYFTFTCDDDFHTDSLSKLKTIMIGLHHEFA